MDISFITELHTTIRAKRVVHTDTHFQTTPSAKKYTRFPQFTLPPVGDNSTTLASALRDRVSSSSPMSGKPISLIQLSKLLGYSLKIREDGHRPHPSGGGKYPIEAYILSFGVNDLERAVYHYRPDTHALENLWPIPKGDNPHTFFLDQGNYCEKASALVVFTAMWERSAHKYGTFAYQLALLEAGHIGQNILLTASALGICARPFGGFKDDILMSTLDLEKDSEQPIYLVVLGM